MRATAHSKLNEEAKQKADLLIEVYPQFEFKVKKFLKKVCKHNKDIFNNWKGLLRTVEKCTNWALLQIKYISSQLQYLPGENGMFQVILRMIFLIQFYSNR